LIDPPPAKALAAAHDTLRMLRLLDDDGAITALGRAALAVPAHPRLAAMVRRAADSGDRRRAWIACVLASLLEERDVFTGRPSELPVDVGLRVDAVLGNEIGRVAEIHHGARERVARGARDIARRLGIDPCEVDSDSVHQMCGALLLAAYPDRLAMRRSSPGQFVLRTGNGALMDRNDGLAGESFVVAADLDGGRGNARIRRAAGITMDDVAGVLGDDLAEDRSLQWDKERDDLVVRVVRRFAALRLDERTMPAPAGEESVAALLDRIRGTRLGLLDWDDASRGVQQRLLFMRRHRGDEWPDVSDRSLLSRLDEWIGPYLVGCTCRDDVRRLDPGMLLRAGLSWDQSAELEVLAPAEYDPPRGRPVRIDYSDPAAPRASIRVQHLFGVTGHPAVLGGAVPLIFELLSPADRPIQITADLPGFWIGSWGDVRKEMAGRYPKHDWLADPSAAG